MIRPTLRIAAAALALLVAACETPAAAPPPPPPPAPAITLAPSVVQLASAYQVYIRQASGIPQSFSDGPSIQTQLRVGAGYEPRQLASGQIAYAAIVALQEPTFVAALRGYAADEGRRIAVRDAIFREPAYVVGVQGSDLAAGLIVTALNGEGRRVRGVGDALRQHSFAVQSQAWSKARIPAPELRLAEARAISARQIVPTLEETTRLSEAALGRNTLSLAGAALPPPYTPTVVRGMAIAALAALGEGGEANAAQLQLLLAAPDDGFCMNMAKLNLFQCLAVARPWYEDVFCLGQHGLIDTGQCIASGAGEPPVVAPATQATPVAVTAEAIAGPASATVR